MSEDQDYSHFIDRLIKRQVEDSVDQIHAYGLDVKANHIYIVGEEGYNTGQGVEETYEPGVEHMMASKFIKNLNILMRTNDDPILIHLKTCGGIWEEGIAIYDAIKACPNPVTILNYTHARSMSSLIFQAAEKRVMMPHSCFMFHEGDHSYGGTAKQLQTEAAWARKNTEQMLDIYVEVLKTQGSKSRLSKTKIREWLRDEMNKKEEVYLTAKETVALGFADEIFGEDGTYDWATLTEYPED